MVNEVQAQTCEPRANGEIKLVQPFVEALAEVVDYRQQPQYELKAILTVIVLGLLCGQNSERQIAVWAQHMPVSLRRRLKLPHLRTPGRGTIQRTVARVKVDSLVQVWQEWIEDALKGWVSREALPGLAIDGKTLRGSANRASGTAALEVLGAMVHGLGVMLTNHPIPETTSEAGALQPFLESLLLEGRVITLDAAHTSQATEHTIVQKGGTTSCG
jgi:DDE_Tnp_1-associated